MASFGASINPGLTSSRAENAILILVEAESTAVVLLIYGVSDYCVECIIYVVLQLWVYVSHCSSYLSIWLPTRYFSFQVLSTPNLLLFSCLPSSMELYLGLKIPRDQPFMS